MSDVNAEVKEKVEPEKKKAKDETKVTADNEKWGKVDNGLFVGEDLVQLMIPVDKQNPAKERFVCINGNQIWLAVGKPLTVPKSVADLWNYSYVGTIEAEEKMNQEIEIKA
jgi:hypothetical protein